MDDTTKTILGMIAAFITAFLAEPVKTWFEEWARSRRLRHALYRELLYDYVFIGGLLSADVKDDEYGRFAEFMKAINQHALRTESYQAAISTQLSMFYELKEAPVFNHLYARLTILTKLPFDLPELSTERRVKLLRRYTVGFMNAVEEAVHGGGLNRELVNKIMLNEDAGGLLERAKDFPASGTKLPDETQVGTTNGEQTKS